MSFDFNHLRQIASKVINSPSQRTPNLGLGKEVFRSHGQPLIAIQQNPNTKSKWAELAREGKKVVQFRDAAGKYVAVSVDGRVIPYGSKKE